MATNAIKLMLSDVCKELLEKAAEARAEAKSGGSDYAKGRQFALYEVVSLLISQAETFGVERSEIGLGEIDPELDLLG